MNSATSCMRAKTLDLRNLTPEARNAAINEAVAVMDGWRSIQPSPFGPCIHVGFKDSHGKTEAMNSGSRWGVPNYATSCDAVMPLLEKMPSTKRDEFYYHLSTVLNSKHRMATIGWLLITATASDRCIALLRAHGWEVLT